MELGREAVPPGRGGQVASMPLRGASRGDSKPSGHRQFGRPEISSTAPPLAILDTLLGHGRSRMRRPMASRSGRCASPVDDRMARRFLNVSRRASFTRIGPRATCVRSSCCRATSQKRRPIGADPMSAVRLVSACIGCGEARQPPGHESLATGEPAVPFLSIANPQPVAARTKPSTPHGSHR